MFTIKTMTANAAVVNVAVVKDPGDKEREMLSVGYFECVHFQVRHYRDRTEIALFRYPQDEEDGLGSGPDHIVLCNEGPRSWVEAYIENANGKTIDHIKLPSTDSQCDEVVGPGGSIEEAGVFSTERGVVA